MKTDESRRALLLACITAVGHFLALGMVQPLISLYASELGASPVLIGLIMSSFGFIPMLIAIPVGVMTDRVSPRVILAWGAYGTVAGLALLVFSRSYAGILVAYTLMGCAHVLSLVAAQSYVSAISTPKNRDAYFGYYGSGTSAGSTAAPALAGGVVVLAGYYTTSALGTYRIAFFVAMLLSLAPAVVALLLPRPTTYARPIPVDKSLARLLHSPGIHLMFLATFIHIASVASRLSFYPLYLTSVGYTTGAIGLIFSVHSASALVVRPFLGAIVTRWPREAVFYSSLLLLVVSNLTIPLSNHWGFQVLNVVMAGVGNGIVQPLTIALVATSCQPGEQGMGMGLRFVVNRLAVVVAPVAFGILAGRYALGQTFIFTSMALFALLVVTAWWARWRRGKTSAPSAEVAS